MLYRVSTDYLYRFNGTQNVSFKWKLYTDYTLHVFFKDQFESFMTQFICYIISQLKFFALNVSIQSIQAVSMCYAVDGNQ